MGCKLADVSIEASSLKSLPTDKHEDKNQDAKQNIAGKEDVCRWFSWCKCAKNKNKQSDQKRR